MELRSFSSALVSVSVSALSNLLWVEMPLKFQSNRDLILQEKLVRSKINSMFEHQNVLQTKTHEVKTPC